ncbi:hypothetical protein KIW84_034674 [Lathyrus oleraceus]|uniref:Histone-lysine N-methyltransferase CLF-like HTH domain-containing protein n=1 Tax=Pisum sativum TaxID=3888 RepID=A0A9D4Y0Y5_PEA|nr:hypothetical protein KIW84_034674 [Pisum sativum]
MAAVSRNTSLQTEEANAKMLSSRIGNPISKFSGFRQGLGRREQIQNQDVSFEKSFKLPYTEKIPTYTFWLNLARNERMTKDQSFAARRNIYYDQHCGETRICSDTEEECKENREAKHDFSQGEDQILWMAFEEHDFTEEALSVVQRCIGGTCSEIQVRVTFLGESTVKEYLLCINTLVDSLASVGDSIPAQQHIDVVLEVLDAVSSAPDGSSSTQVPSYESSHVSNHSGYVLGRGGRTIFRGGRGRHGSIQCQVCFKFGHIATNCYHRFNQQFYAFVPP